MSRPRLSLGAWIFATAALVLAVAAPVSYAAVTSTVAIGDTTNAQIANVVDQHLLTSPTGTQNQVAGANAVSPGCNTVYSPPAGRAIVITSVTYDVGSGTAGTEAFTGLVSTCPAGNFYDYGDTTQAYDTFQHTFPVGLPLTNLAVYASSASSNDTFSFTGYLIPTNQLPPTSQIPHISRHRLAKLNTAKPTK